MKEKLLKEFEEWLNSKVKKNTANSYKSEIRRLDSESADLGLPGISKWHAHGYDRVIRHLKQNKAWYDGNKKRHHSSSAAVRQFFQFLANERLEKKTDYLEPYLLDTFLSRVSINEILVALKTKKNIILQGPPGTGKTFIAKRLSYAQMNEAAEDRVEVVQFHQSYGYEDFIQGFRPKESGGFQRKDGVFFRFCDKARSDSSHDYFFLIDEINRGNLSKIFGELMMLIEADKRGTKYQLQLTYSNQGEHFFIPENVHIIGTMNTADRSLAMVDYALRRRFAFFHMSPQFNVKFESYLRVECGISASMIKRIVAKVTALNKIISNDKNLGDGFEIGHSYFCTDVPEGRDEVLWYNHIVDHEIGPQLKEYWFDEKKRALDQIELLKA